MKTLRNGFLALALLAGVSVAVVSKVQALPKQNDPTYDWTGSGTLHSGELDNATVTAATDYYGCPAGTAHVCATGTLDQGSGPATQTIKKL